MGKRRIDRIQGIVEQHGGRVSLKKVLEKLIEIEKNDTLTTTAIHIAINAENKRLEELGERIRFKTARHGEQRGYVRLEKSSSFAQGSKGRGLEHAIEDANRQVDSQLLDRLRAMDWREFESTFLTEVLEKLGFQDVEITQATRDGGTDARVNYRRGIVEANAIVSAKRWSKSSVGVEEVRMLRGIQGNEDTAIVVTTGTFTSDAQEEAKPSQNQRVVYLIDGARLIDICKRYEIGVKKVQLPELIVIDEEYFGIE